MRARSVMNCVGALAGALSLGACVTASEPVASTAAATPASNWQIAQQSDRITGGPPSGAAWFARSANSRMPGTAPMLLRLTCFKDQPVVQFSFDHKVGSNRNAVFGYRFDAKPGREIKARFLQDYKTVVIEDRTDVAQFADALRASDLLLIRIQSLNTGNTTAEFKLEGSTAAVDAGFAACPLAPSRARTVARS